MAEDKSVIALFVDVRGFTRWAEANEVFVNLASFVEGLLTILGRHFRTPDWHLKPLGDGALLVSEVPSTATAAETAKLLGKVLGQIKRVESEFKTHCDNFAKKVGHSTKLDLGWGVVRGKVMVVGSDWAGHNLNKCSRLCDEARPFGIVLDRDDFPKLPAGAKSFVPQVRRLVGIGEVRVWATSEIASKFVPRERLREQPEVHVAGTCVSDSENGDLRILIAKRSMDRSLYPGKYEGCGGQLRHSEGFTDGVRRHFRLEFGIDVDVLQDLHLFYEIREPDEPLIPGIRFLCRQVGDAKPESPNHTDVSWVSEADFRRMPAEKFVDSLKQEVLDLINRYRVTKGATAGKQPRHTRRS